MTAALISAPGTTDAALSAIASTVASNNFLNLASSAVLILENASTTSGELYLGNVSTTQTGTTGSNSLTVELYSNAPTNLVADVGVLNVKGDYQLTINSSESAAGTGVTNVIENITDGNSSSGAATLTSILVTSSAYITKAPSTDVGSGLTIGAITDTALTTIDASGSSKAFNLGSAPAPITNAGITIKGGSGANTIYASGNGDIFTAKSKAAETIVMSGNSDSITVGVTSPATSANVTQTQTGAITIAASGTGDTIDVHALTSASSKAIAIYGATSSAGVGSNATVKLGIGYGTSDYQSVKVGSNTSVYLGGDYDLIDLSYASAYGTTGNLTSVSMGTYSAPGTGLNTSVTAYAATDAITPKAAGTTTTITITPANVSGATSLANALDIAATYAENAISPTGVTAAYADVTWMQYAGNTYVVEVIGTGATGTHSTTGLDTTDLVVKINGLVDITAPSTNLIF